MATHILGGSFGPGKAIRATQRISRRSGEDRIEARVAQLEATTQHIQSDVNDLKTEVRGLRDDLNKEVATLRSEFRSDFRLMFGTIVTMFVAVVGLLVRGFNMI